MGSCLLPGLEVDDLSVCGLVDIPKILGDYVAHAGNLGELVAYLGNSEVEVLWADKEDIVTFALPDGSQESRNQLDQTTGLLELFIFFEEGDNVLESRVERISRLNLVGNCFCATISNLGLGSLFKLSAIGIRDIGNFGFIRE